MSSVHPNALLAAPSAVLVIILSAFSGAAGIGCGSTPADPTPEAIWEAFDASDVPFHVHGIFPDGGRLFATGYSGFRGDRVMEWNGAEWDHVWSGRSPHRVNALAVFHGTVALGGPAGPWEPNTIPPSSLTEVTGPYSEQVLAGGVDGTVGDMVVYRGELIVGGHFVHAALDSIPYLARWDGIRWRALGDGVDGPVVSLALERDRLLVAGRFTRAGSEVARGIAWWDGVGWTSLGFDLIGEIEIATVHQGTVVVTGWFKKAGGPSRFEVARWYGGEWEPVGTPAPSVTTNVPCFHDGRLYIGADRGVRRWETSAWEWNQWTPRPVFALISYRGSLIAGGRGWAPQLGQWVPNIMRVEG